MAGRRRLRTAARACAGLLAAGAPSVEAATVVRAPFGTTRAGEPVEAITLANAHGIAATILSYGAVLQQLREPDQRGRVADVVLGFPDLAGYEAGNAYFGAAIGRVANRIVGGRFLLDGRSYALPSGPGGKPAGMHGGLRGFDKHVWRVVRTRSGPIARVVLALESPDGDQGFPGALHVRATVSLDEADRLEIAYVARCDAPTVVALTHHDYFNLAGEGSSDALGQDLQVLADAYLPIDPVRSAPDGRFAPVAGTPFDFRRPRAVEAGVRDASDPQVLIGHGYDHAFVLRGTAGGLRVAARLHDPASGRRMTLFTDQPGLQVYSGNYLNGSLVGPSGRAYRQGDGLALEPENFPDAVNRPTFPSPRLAPGQVYRWTTIYALSVDRKP